MTRSEDELKALVKRAVMIRTVHPALSIHEAMKVATFTLEKSTDHSLQMRVHRASAPPSQAINVNNSSPSTFKIAISL